MGQSLEEAKPVSKETQVPTWEIAGMIDPAPEEVKSAVQVKSRVPIRISDRPINIQCQCGCDPLVGIQDQNPLIPKLQVLQCPVLLARPSRLVCELHNTRPAAL